MNDGWPTWALVCAVVAGFGMAMCFCTWTVESGCIDYGQLTLGGHTYKCEVIKRAAPPASRKEGEC